MAPPIVETQPILGDSISLGLRVLELNGSQNFGARETSPLLGATRALCNNPLFAVLHMAILGVDTGHLLQLAATLCETASVTASCVEVEHGGERYFDLGINTFGQCSQFLTSSDYKGESIACQTSH